MKKVSAYTLILAGFLLLSLSNSLFAQNNEPATAHLGKWNAEGRADKMTDKLTRQLGLTKDQSREIYAINLDILRQTDSIHVNKTLTSKERMGRLHHLNNERNQRFKTVLTAAQYKKWNDWNLNKKEQLEAKMEKKRQRREAHQQQ
ncbi:hypothetical protein CLV59_101104 [Chitinophaga dinghuensis]|uniref:LTXXQ motif family protein n=1 Tax=Chitinophaga dinghuensis TaxID=1539050 RepID=A0A327W9S9_9BACT|nr:hypothetical protein [Chitinophaga dinghuensis]RAJ87355.1 hypothetical protein CLV59_101104 [Chitinophaga dinghuensis]